MAEHGCILPGATLGVLGGGQLGRMFAIAARRMGYRIHVLDPDGDCPAAQVADRHIAAAYHDVEAARELAAACDVVTFEFENVPAETLAALEELAPVRPSPRVLATCRHRLSEKRFLESVGLAVAPYREVTSFETLEGALEELGFPAILKTAEFGYDGKGQARLDTRADARRHWPAFEGRAAVLEGFVRFEAELSVIVARGLDGDVRAYPLVRNAHARHILDVTTGPAAVSSAIEARAREIARAVAEGFDLAGLVAIELFLADGELLVNELAPRPHNSGHGTIEAAVTCQFEQHVRAICGLPLGGTAFTSPFAMANLLGDLWQDGEPDWSAALSVPGVRLHLYGKADPRPGRKMGHLTALATTAEAAEAAVRQARSRL